MTMRRAERCRSGTTAKVTNLETGKSAFVTIQDRGPYVDGRIVDLSPATAREIGISPRQGIAKVEVSPLAVPLPNGGVKLGAAATPAGALSGAQRSSVRGHSHPSAGSQATSDSSFTGLRRGRFAAHYL